MCEALFLKVLHFISTNGASFDRENRTVPMPAKYNMVNINNCHRENNEEAMSSSVSFSNFSLTLPIKLRKGAVKISQSSTFNVPSCFPKLFLFFFPLNFLDSVKDRFQICGL